MSLLDTLAKYPIGGGILVRGGIRVPNSDDDPGLAFMLAQQAISRWQLDVERLGEAADAGEDTEAIVTEAAGAIQQIVALADRVTPFANFIDIAVRFEAQEILAGLESLRMHFDRVARLARPNMPWMDASQVVEQLHAKRH